MDNDLEENGNDFKLVGAVVVFVIAATWLLTYALLKDLAPEDRGTFGDMFGSINSLFSGLALAGIILTILLQRQELKLQRKELADTRREFKIQNETLKLQRFESLFFNLVDLHHSIMNAIDFRYYKRKEKDGFVTQRMAHNEELEAVTIKSRDVFRYRYNKMFVQMKPNPEEYESIYMNHYQEAQTDFGHYFRNIYRIIKLVDETDFLIKEGGDREKELFKLRYKYTSIIRAQLSDYELLWLFYNCVSENGVEKFKPYIEKYSLLKNIPIDKLAAKEHVRLYDKKAIDPK